VALPLCRGGCLGSLSAVTACPECGFVYEDVALDEVAPAMVGLGAQFRSALESADQALVRLRPNPSVWSAHEYASHVRDVLLVQRERVVLACVEARPSLARMHREERIAICRYEETALVALLSHLEMASELCATAFGGLSAGSWSRRFVYNWPDPAEHDLAWLGRHTLHEGVHHLGDVRRVIAAAIGHRPEGS
jgi:S-DNA-T family DNA segregation ATPase FtsK/SpoIIIE